jgi:hypothetical protein
MRSIYLALSTLLLCPPLTANASKQIMPAGSLINCTISQPKLSSKTAAVGDPVLCQASITSRNSSARLPFNTYLEGRFEDYKDPGHFIGKGWMELKFDRVVVGSRDIFPIDAKVVDVPGFNVDRDGKILGKGHRTRDIVKWCIPILWPIDLLTLPGRGPRPTLKSETRLTLLVMDDTEIPSLNDREPERDPSGLYHRQPSSYDDDGQEEQPQPRISQNAPPPQPTYQQPAYQQAPTYQPAQQQYQAPQQSYAAPAYLPVMPVYVQQPPQTVVVYAQPPQPPPVYVYTQPAVTVYSQPRMPAYPNTMAMTQPYGYGAPYGFGSPRGYGYGY